MKTFSKNNNFDILRLLAALQVVVYHGYEHFHLEGKSVAMDFFINSFLRYFPGVVIFFAISGFLIMSSFDRNKNLKKYFVNRFLRLYPGLWVSFLVTFFILIGYGFFNSHTIFSSSGLTWIIGQLSFMQFYTPDFLRGYGLGNPNGSLWTIVVEIQYYLIVPILFWILKKVGVKLKYSLIVLLILSIAFNRIYSTYLTTDSNLIKLIGVTIGPFLFYFICGALVYLFYNSFDRYLLKSYKIALIVYCLFYSIFSIKLGYYDMSYWPNNIGLIAILLLTWLTFCIAFAPPFKLTSMLHGNDLSYGLYIYHGIVLNFIIHNQFEFTFELLLVYILLSILLSYLSWRFVEKRSLELKSKF